MHRFMRRGLPLAGNPARTTARWRRIMALVVGLAAMVVVLEAAAATQKYIAGAVGAGDAYFPHAGNGGFDVQHYDLDLEYAPPDPDPAPLVGHLDGVATIDLVATQDLDRFNLDLRGLDVESVTVNGKSAVELASPPAGKADGAAYWQVQDDAQRLWELVIQPRPKLKRGSTAKVVVAYAGDTTRPEDIEGVLYGWVTTRDGAMVVGEPEGSMTWYPVSDHPTDKATYTFEITVPEGKAAVANGLQTRDPITADGRTTWYWDAPDAQASFLTTASVGDFVLSYSETADGLPIVDAIDDALTPANRDITEASLALQPAMIDFFESSFNAYPFNSYGSIVDDDTLGYATASQTRPVYSRVAREGTVAFELARQWFGNAVSPQRWQDIWLTLGWATYAEWMWSEEQGGDTTQAIFDQLMADKPADDPFWNTVIADPGPFDLFVAPVYDRGAATLQALRVKVGDEAFFAGAQLWLERFDDADGTTEDFQAVYEEASGQDLSTFFDVWLRTPSKPATW